jgi:hypothetical protein
MREADLDSLEIPTIDPPALFTIVRTVRLWIDEEGWGVLDSTQPRVVQGALFYDRWHRLPQIGSWTGRRVHLRACRTGWVSLSAASVEGL